MTYKIYVFGKLKERYLTEGVEDYLSRLSHYRDFQIIELKDESEPKNASPKDLEALKEKEAQTFLKAYKNGPIILWDETGKKQSSPDFSEWLNQLESMHTQDLNFVVGGSHGHAKSVKQKAHSMISMSDMTFPHGLFRLIILEQFYRAFKIQRNETYHK